MKPIPSLLFPLFLATQLFAQDDAEFRTNANGLMYSDSAMARLRLMVNSQNILFKTCDLNKTFYSYPQARVFELHFESPRNLKEIRSALDNGENFYTVLAKFQAFITSIDTGGIAILRIETEDGKKKMNSLTGNPLDGYSQSYRSEKTFIIPEANSWHYDDEKPDRYDSLYHIDASWYPEAFHTQPIPAEYGKLIQYVDCMIDTNAQVFLTNNYPHPYVSNNQPKKQGKAISYVQSKATGSCVDKPGKEGAESSLTQFASGELRNDPVLIQLIKEEVAYILEKDSTDIELEELCAAVGLKQELLTLLRSRRVFGRCSADESPRLHALEIASLAGETQQWDIFMRAHMDILNDRFERMSDGSYAWEQRQTYLRELEELGLHVNDIMLGMSLRSSNAAPNHYDGTVWRLGKAMTESSDRKGFEKRISKLILDPTLDAFNRGLCLLMLSSYLQRLPNIDEANSTIQWLKDNNNLSSIDHVGIAIRKMEPRIPGKEE